MFSRAMPMSTIADRHRSAPGRAPSRRPSDSIQGFSSLVASISVLVCIPRKFDERGWKWRTKRCDNTSWHRTGAQCARRPDRDRKREMGGRAGAAGAGATQVGRHRRAGTDCAGHCSAINLCDAQIVPSLGTFSSETWPRRERGFSIAAVVPNRCANNGWPRLSWRTPPPPRDLLQSASADR
jgi:hypothetical protein